MIVSFFAGGTSSKLFHQGCFKYLMLKHDDSYNNYTVEECKAYCKNATNDFFVVAEEKQENVTVSAII